MKFPEEMWLMIILKVRVSGSHRKWDSPCLFRVNESILYVDEWRTSFGFIIKNLVKIQPLMISYPH